VYNLIIKFCKHQNSRLSICAFRALEVFFIQVANELLSEKRNLESNKETFRFFMKEFWNGIESPSSTISEVL